jgi:hypothetical protein
MQELESYECFAIPQHAWTAPAELAALVVPQRHVARPPVPGSELLGIEAIPSPSSADFTLHG